MQMHDEGKTILFCSHSLFQVESLCARAIWINQGEIVIDGDSAQVVAAYQKFLDTNTLDTETNTLITASDHQALSASADTDFRPGSAHLKTVHITVDGKNYKDAAIISGQSCCIIKVTFVSDPALPTPNVAITLHSMDGRTISSAATWEDNIPPQRLANGAGEISLKIDPLPLLKGEYLISAHLLCERGLHVYESAIGIATILVQQEGRLQGYFTMTHAWENKFSKGLKTID